MAKSKPKTVFCRGGKAGSPRRHVCAAGGKRPCRNEGNSVYGKAFFATGDGKTGGKRLWKTLLKLCKTPLRRGFRRFRIAAFCCGKSADGALGKTWREMGKEPQCFPNCENRPQGRETGDRPDFLCDKYGRLMVTPTTDRRGRRSLPFAASRPPFFAPIKIFKKRKEHAPARAYK